MPNSDDLEYYRNRVDTLQYRLDLWVAAGNYIMETAFGRSAPLSDSDVCGLIVEQRVIIREKNNRIAQLEARIAELEAGRQPVIL